MNKMLSRELCPIRSESALGAAHDHKAEGKKDYSTS